MLSMSYVCRLAQIGLTGALLAVPLLSFAQPGDPTDNTSSTAWWRGIATHGFISVSDSYNTNNPAPRLNQFRVFDFNDDDPQLDVAQLVVLHTVSESGHIGFRLNFIAGYGVH